MSLRRGRLEEFQRDLERAIAASLVDVGSALGLGRLAETP